MAKQLAFDAEARNALCRGVDKVARAVRATLGPRGRAVLLDSKMGAPTITLDGATVAREIELENPVENLGAQLLKEVSTKTQDEAGDGTTTATVLAQAIVVDGLRHIAAGVNPMSHKRGLDRAVCVASQAIADQSREIHTAAEIAQVAAVSANGDDEVGRMVSRAIEETGRMGLASVEASSGLETSLETVTGLRFDHGYLSPYFITDAERLETVLEKALILLCNQRISNLQTLLPVLERVASTGRPFLVVAEDVDGEALSTLVVNALRDNLRAVAVKAPGIGERRLALLEDLAVLTGGRVIDTGAGAALENAALTDLGSARRVVVGKDHTTIIDGDGNVAEIARRRAELDRQLESATVSYERQKIEERRAHLAGAVAVIRVGAATEFELRDKQVRFEDALSATRAALKEGIVVGGGLSLLRASEALRDLEATDDERSGIQTLERALAEPLRRLALNSGTDGGTVIAEVQRCTGTVGFNALTLEYEDLFAAGIIDPTLVVRTALHNAASIGGLLLTTDAVVSDRPDDGGREDEELA